MNILSIQSSVVFGHVGNSAAVFTLQRLGHEAWPIDTVQFSNHTGYGSWSGQVFGAEHLTDLVDGIDQRGILGHCDAVLSGYLGEAAIGRVILDAVSRVRSVNGKALFCCDPVMGDAGRGLFVRPDIPSFFAEHALPAADLITPNQFELELLNGGPITGLKDAIAAARRLQARGPSLVAVTSLQAPAVPSGRLGSLLVSPAGAWLVDTPLLPFDRPPAGAGDVFAAFLLGRLLAGTRPPEALERTVNGVYHLLADSLAERSAELMLAVAQEKLVQPPRLHSVRQVG